MFVEPSPYRKANQFSVLKDALWRKLQSQLLFVSCGKKRLVLNLRHVGPD